MQAINRIVNALACTALLLGAGAVLGVFATRGNPLAGIRGEIKQATDIRSSIVQATRDASDLTTIVMPIQVVIAASQSWEVAGIPLDESNLLYIAQGEVRAGIDLSGISILNMAVGGNEIRICLPPPQIQDAKVDVARSRVYSSRPGTFMAFPPQLVASAQKDALKEIRTSAEDAGVLELAKVRSGAVMANLVDPLAQGREVTVQFDGDEGCPNRANPKPSENSNEAEAIAPVAP